MPDHTKIVVQVRGEIGEIVYSWALLQHFRKEQAKHASGDLQRDFANEQVCFCEAIISKLWNEIVSRLSELAEPVKRGQLTLENLTEQLRRAALPDCRQEVERFRGYIKGHHFHTRRNDEISHKKFIHEWKDERAPLFIEYKHLVRAIALAIRLIKKVDRHIYGAIHAQFMWHELRKMRYKHLPQPISVWYMIAQHIQIPEPVRAAIIKKEIEEDRFHLELMETTVNGMKMEVYVSKRWGAINLGGQLIVLPQYPLQELHQIEFGGSVNDEPEQP